MTTTTRTTTTRTTTTATAAAAAAASTTAKIRLKKLWTSSQSTMTPSGIEPTTFRFVAQHRNH